MTCKLKESYEKWGLDRNLNKTKYLCIEERQSNLKLHKDSEIEFFQEYKHLRVIFNPLKPELNPICYLLALLGAHHFLHVSRIRVKLLILRLLMSYIYGVPILDVSRSHTTTQHSR